MILYSNNASTTLASGISNSATTIVVATGTGSLFPTISSVDDYFNVTLTDSAKHIEIVTVTARTGDIFTVMRGMENTTARAWLASDILELRITKGLLDQLKLDATKDSALDALVVHNLGNETVQGTKTFSDGIITSGLQLSGGTGDQGTMSWNPDEETVDLIQDGATLQLGQELQVHCRNNTVSNIGNAVVVMATGTIGMSGRITIAPWDGTTDIKYILGVTTEVIEAGTDGKVTTFGKVREVDTGVISGTLTTGVIYAKTDGTGGLTYTKPASNAVPLAFLVSAESAPSANNGTIMVRVTPVSETTLDHAETVYGWGNHASAGYATASNLSAHTGNTSNPHSVTATQVGLGNVTNESKATMFTSPTFTGNAVLGTPASGNFSTGTFTWPTFNQNTSGNAATATTLQTARTINGVSFNGSANITITADPNSHTHSIDTITDEHRLFNNMGLNHSSYTDFNTSRTSGANFMQGGTNGPTGTASHQFYGFKLGLGNDYDPASQYASQLYWARQSQGGGGYLWARDMEGGSWGSWRKMYAGYADSAGNADTLDGNHASAFSLTSHNHNGTYLTSVPAATSSTYGGVKVSLSGTTLTITV